LEIDSLLKNLAPTKLVCVLAWCATDQNIALLKERGILFP